MVIQFFQHHPDLASTAAGGKALAAVLPHVVTAVRELQAVEASSSRLALSGRWPGAPWPIPPAWFRRDAACIEMGESTDGAGSSNLYGMLDGWGAAGGSSSPDAWHASPAEQLYRVWVLYNLYGWGPWTTALGCGL
jgi:hypothetical protein